MALDTSPAAVAEPAPRRRRRARRSQGRSPLAMAMQRLRRDKLAVICTAVVVLLFVLGLGAPLWCHLWGIYADQPPDPSNPTKYLAFDGSPTIGPPYASFTWAHPLGLQPGTSYDNLARLLYGLRTSLLIATAATVVSTVVGVVLGLLSGFSSGWIDRIISFVTDFFLCFPFILGALVLAPIIIDRFATRQSALNRAQIIALVGLLVIFGWMSLSRLIRGEVFSLREREFVLSARVIGVSTPRILFKELLPNLVAPIVITFSLTLPDFVAAEAGLSYLGLGISGSPTLGQTINAAVQGHAYANYPLWLWAPVVTVIVLVLALNLLGDCVRDAFDPRTRS